MSMLDARVRIREGLRELLDDGHPLAQWPAPRLTNRVLDRCGSDHRPLVELVLFVAPRLPAVDGPPIDRPAWPAHLDRCVDALARDAFLEPDPARWAVETVYWVHRRIDEAQLAPVLPFTSAALPIAAPSRHARSVVPRAPTIAVPRRSMALHAGIMASPVIAGGAAMQTLQRGASAGGLRFGQPWYAVQNGGALIALPSPSRGRRRPPPIAPISTARPFTGWTRQTFATAGALGAATLTIAFSYWLMLNAARDETAREIIARAPAVDVGPVALPPRSWRAAAPAARATGMPDTPGATR